MVVEVYLEGEGVLATEEMKNGEVLSLSDGKINKMSSTAHWVVSHRVR